MHAAPQKGQVVICHVAGASPARTPADRSGHGRAVRPCLPPPRGAVHLAVDRAPPARRSRPGVTAAFCGLSMPRPERRLPRLSVQRPSSLSVPSPHVCARMAASQVLLYHDDASGSWAPSQASTHAALLSELRRRPGVTLFSMRALNLSSQPQQAQPPPCTHLLTHVAATHALAHSHHLCCPAATPSPPVLRATRWGVRVPAFTRFN